jgi:single-strand DNA-binding protein
MNSITLNGNIVKDHDVRMTNSGKPVINFTVAVRRNKEETDFIECVAFDKTAEVLRDYTGKGSPILLQGRLQTRTYEDKNGQNRKVWEVWVERVELLGRKEEKKEETPTRYEKQSVFHQQVQEKKKDDIDSESLPF